MASTGATALGSQGLLGDTAERDYSRKLKLFNAFAEPELCRAIASVGIKPGMRILDAGCGTGHALRWLFQETGHEGEVIGIDLAAAHVAAARTQAADCARVLQADLLHVPLEPASVDLIWCVNTINHLHDPVRGIEALAPLLRPGGHIVLGQSSLLPDMYFAWDARLEQRTNEAVHRYYRERYSLSEERVTAVRSLVGWLRRAKLRGVTVRTFVIERVAPLSAADEEYLLQAIFQNTWGERLWPYLSEADYAELTGLCDPSSSRFALHRPDFHFLQTFTLAMGQV